jgi:hypothetical protein
MSCATKGPGIRRPVVRQLSVLLLACVTLLIAPAALAVDSGDIVVVSVKGEVHIAVNGSARKVPAGGVLELPAILRTGRDGAIELRQGATTLSVGPETQLEFPALEKRGAPIDRIVQPRGNVFYSIGKREGRKLRIETPFLVGVVKGTQFNVAAQDETTTISLFEGLLEVHAADESGVVDLKAGEMASRQRDDKGVAVSRMDGGKSPAAPPRRPQGAASGDVAPKFSPSRASAPDRDSMMVENPAAVLGGAVGAANVEPTPLSGSPEVTAPATIDASPAIVDVGVGISAGGPGVEGPTASVDPGATGNVDTGSVSVDLGVTADPGNAGNASVTVGASAPQIEVSVGSDVAADAISGTTNIGLEVSAGDHAPDLGINVDLDDGNNGHGNDTDHSDSSNPGSDKNNDTPASDVGAVLDGLVRRHGRK